MTHDAIPRRRIAVLFCAMMALSPSVIGCKRSATPPEPEPPPAPIKWEEARQVNVEEWIELIGSTQPLPDHAARVTSPVSGRVTTVLPREGDKPIVEGQKVNVGDVLVQLDATLIQASLAKAEAAKKVTFAEREVAAVTLKQAEVDLKSLEELKRSQSGPSPLVSPVMLEKASLALEAAKATLRSLDCRLEAAEKEESAIKLEMGLYTLRSPRAGRLGRIQVVTGQTLAAGAVVAEVMGIDEAIDVLCFVPSADARKLQVSQPAQFGGFPRDPKKPAESRHEGKVEYVAPHAEPDTGLFAVKVRFPNTALQLRAGAVTRVRVMTAPGKFCWAVPESALMEDQEPPGIVVVEDVVTVKNADGKDEQRGKVRRLKAIVGRRDRLLGQVEIIRLEDREKKWKGDFEHALIVIEKGRGLQTGDAVKFEEEDDEEAPKTDEKP